MRWVVVRYSVPTWSAEYFKPEANLLNTQPTNQPYRKFPYLGVLGVEVVQQVDILHLRGGDVFHVSHYTITLCLVLFSVQTVLYLNPLKP